MPEWERKLRPAIDRRQRLPGAAANRLTCQAIVRLDPIHASLKLILVVRRRVDALICSFVTGAQLWKVPGHKAHIVLAHRGPQSQRRVAKERRAMVARFP